MRGLAVVMVLGTALFFAAPVVAAQHGGAEPAAAHGAAGHGEAAHGEAGHGEAGAHEVHVNWFRFPAPKGENQPFLATLINFIVLALLLGRFGLPPIREYVKSRHERIAKDLNEAQRLRAEAEERLKEYEAKVANLDQEIATLLQGIRSDAEGERARIIAAAEAQAERLRKDAELSIAQEMKRVRAEIEREAVTAALVAAEETLRAKITVADQRNFAERYLVNLAPSGAPTAPRAPTGGGAA